MGTHTVYKPYPTVKLVQVSANDTINVIAITRLNMYVNSTRAHISIFIQGDDSPIRIGVNREDFRYLEDDKFKQAILYWWTDILDPLYDPVGVSENGVVSPITVYRAWLNYIEKAKKLSESKDYQAVKLD